MGIRVKKEPPARGNGERNDIHLKKKCEFRNGTYEEREDEERKKKHSQME